MRLGMESVYSEYSELGVNHHADRNQRDGSTTTMYYYYIDG